MLSSFCQMKQDIKPGLEDERGIMQAPDGRGSKMLRNAISGLGPFEKNVGNVIIEEQLRGDWRRPLVGPPLIAGVGKGFA